jgi:SAM-dependent methyltransferase
LSSWKTKAALQRLLSKLPWRQQIYHWVRWRVIKTLKANPSEHEKRLSWAARHMEYTFKHSGQEKLPSRILELGTGEFPTVPIALFLCGAERVTTLDIEKLFHRGYFLAMLEALASIPRDTMKKYLPALKDARLAILKQTAENAQNTSTEAILSTFKINYQIMDARKLTFEKDSFDLILSNTTLEHIPPDDLQQILTSFHQVLKPEGLMSHLIDMSDHFEHSDHSITAYNYLQFDSETWAKFNTPFLYQNRLRCPDYVRLMDKAGFDSIETWTYAANPQALESLPLDLAFKTYPAESLSITHLWSVTRVK